MSGPRKQNGGEPRQLQIWDAATREFELGTLAESGEVWSLVVVTERAAADLCRGRISFRLADRRLDTDAILLEETEERVVRRAAELPLSTLRQLLAALRG